ncbi:MAG TPA: hypothetical protein VFE37_04165 [Chloroflexota bacterium]|nr:hypothetical protein [Chloroflexota bacterium]
MRRGWGDRELDVPVDTDLGEHLISYLIEHDFDVAHLRRGAERRAHRVSTRSRVPA